MRVTVSGDQIPFEEVAPAGPPMATVLVIPSIYGLHDDLRQKAQALASMGWRAVVVDPFAGTHPGPLGYDRVDDAIARMRTVDRAALLTALGDLCEALPQPVVALGICFGGTFAWRLAAEGRVAGACTWHGGGLQAWGHLQPSVPTQHHFGGADRSVPIGHVSAFAEQVCSLQGTTLHIYGGADHGFTHADHPERHHPVAERGAWLGLLALLQRVVAEKDV